MNIISIILVIALILPQGVYAQSVMNLPTPGTMVSTTALYIPPFLKGMIVNPADPFQFDFIVDSADSGLEGEALKGESSKLIRYFLAALTVPEGDAWVNLSPYEKDRIIPEEFGRTEMGRDLLAQDYLLKQLTASLMYPEDDLGKKFWDRVYKKVQKIYGTNEVPVNTFNKVWIVPEKAVIYEYANTVIILESRLKVMLEEDYLATSKNFENKEIGTNDLQKNEVKELSNVSSSVIRDELIPIIEKEVNEGENFALLRQIYQSMILATWYKTKIKQSPLNQLYSDKKKVDGIEIKEKNIKQDIYDKYIEAFQKGVFDYIKEDYDEVAQEIVPKKYFSGGVNLPVAKDLDSQTSQTHTLTRSETAPVGQYEIHRAGFQIPGEDDNVIGISTMAKSDGGFFGFFKNRGRKKSDGVDSEFSQQRAEITEVPSTTARAGEGIAEFRKYLEMFRQGRVLFSLRLSGNDVAKQLGFGQGFAQVYDELVSRVQRELQLSGSFDANRLREFAQEMIDEIPGEKPPEVTSLSAEVSAGFVRAIASLKTSVERSVSPSEIDRVLKDYDEFVQQQIAENPLQRDMISRTAAKSIPEINEVFIPNGFLIEQSPLGFSDERVFVLYRVDESFEERTLQGPVAAYFVSQVTQFHDGRLRGSPGWSNLFNHYVVVFREAVRKIDDKEVSVVLNGEKPFFARKPDSLKGKEIERLADVAGGLIRAGMSGKTIAERLELQEEATRNHEIEHEVRRRMVGLKEGDIVHPKIDEEIAEVKSMVDSREPLHILAHVIELAAGDKEFAWSILYRLTGRNTRIGAIESLEKYAAEGLDAEKLRTVAKEVYSEVEKEWEEAYDASMIANPGGIDFNSELLELQTRGSGLQINFPDLGSIEGLSLKGLTPVIFNIIPLPSLNALLGLSDNSEKKIRQLSSLY